MSMGKRFGWLSGIAGICIGAATLNAAPILLIDDDFQEDAIGDHTNQLVNWQAQGIAANGVIIDNGGGNHALQTGQNGGIITAGLNLVDNTFTQRTVSIQFDFTDVATNNYWFGLFWSDNLSVPRYRVQWNASVSGGQIIIKKSNTQLGGGFGVTTGFWEGTERTVELTIAFDPSSDAMTGVNTLELFLDGVSQGTREDIGGVTNDGAGNLNRLLPTANGKTWLSNFNNEATALNIIDNVSVTVIPEPASFLFLGAGTLMLLARRRDAHRFNA